MNLLVPPALQSTAAAALYSLQAPLPTVPEDETLAEPEYEQGDTETPVLVMLANSVKTIPDLLAQRSEVIEALRQRVAFGALPRAPRR